MLIPSYNEDGNYQVTNKNRKVQNQKKNKKKRINPVHCSW